MSGWRPSDVDPIDLTNGPKRVHLIGIGGAGMSAIAEVLATLGHRVSGSDRADGPVLDRLRALGIDARAPHDAVNVIGVDVVAASTAIAADNVELVAARDRGLGVHHRYDLLAAIGGLAKTVSISGTHGKTTTSALTALAFDSAGFDPSFIIGGDVAGFDSGSRWTGSEWFVLEADESDSTFLAPPRAAAVVTNIEPDHLDHHGSYEALLGAFVRFVTETRGPVVLCRDDPGAMSLFPLIPDECDKPVTYGLADGSDFRVSDVRARGDVTTWHVTEPGGERRELTLALPGLHLVRNATAAYGVGVMLGTDRDRAIEGLARYRGVGRRFERRGAAAGIEFIDDYAHLPTEVEAVLEACASGSWRRVVAVFQPHRYSRTEAIGAEFGPSFDGADVVVVTDVYAAGEAPRPGVSGRIVVDAIAAARPAQEVIWAPTRGDLVAALVDLLADGDLCLTMGAGDLTTLPDDMLAALTGTTP